jgi:hypothetical protein
MGHQDTLYLSKLMRLSNCTKPCLTCVHKKILSLIALRSKKFNRQFGADVSVWKKDGDNWKASEPESKKSHFFKVNNLLYELNDLEFTQKHDEPEAD